jgi:hypothetical protein
MQYFFRSATQSFAIPSGGNGVTLTTTVADPATLFVPKDGSRKSSRTDNTTDEHDEAGEDVETVQTLVSCDRSDAIATGCFHRAGSGERVQATTVPLTLPGSLA